MLLQIEHRIRYAYDRVVELEPHVLRLRPRVDGTVSLRHFDLAIEPEPAGRSECLDCEGNSMTHAWFSASTRSLAIRTSVAVETHRLDAFDFPLRPRRAVLPMTYGADLAVSLAPYRRRPPAVMADGGVARLAKTIRRDAGGKVLRFLMLLCEHVHERFRIAPYKPGSPEPAGTTLQRGRGTPRDLAWMLVEACRSVGLAARFVTGYHAAVAAGNEQLAAWAEVYLPGGGWRGLDPSAGVPVTDRHVALAAAASPRGAAAVMGTYRGTAQSVLTTDLSVTARDSTPPDSEIVERTASLEAGP